MKALRLILSVVFVLIIALLAYLLVGSIQEPIEFEGQQDNRERTVGKQMERLRDMQEMHRGLTGKYAHDYDTLRDVLQNGQFNIIKVIGNSDARGETVVSYDTIRVSSMDSLTSAGLAPFLDSIEYVPFTDGKATFDMETAIIEFQSTTVPVIEVKVKKATYMGEYADERFMKYDKNYDPEDYLKFGSLREPTIGGNWRK